jgi:hypothetical protein
MIYIEMPSTRKKHLVFVRNDKDHCGHPIKIYKNKDGVLFNRIKTNDNTYHTYKHSMSLLVRLIDGCGPKGSCGAKCRKRLAKTKKNKAKK